MNNNNGFISTNNDETVSVQPNKRKCILNYTISQVASLVGESESEIRYYTNIFDDILKIHVENKELTYSEKDIEKLEFLLRLKNKGLSIKEIQAYCEHISLDGTNISSSGNAVSIEEFLNLIIEKQKIENENTINEIKNYIDTIKEEIITYTDKKINSELLDIKNELKTMLETSVKDTLDGIDKKDDEIAESIKNLSSHIDIKSEKLKDELIFKMNKYENVMQKAYTIEEDMSNAERKSVGFFSRILGFK